MDPVLLVGIISGGSAIVASVGAQVIGAVYAGNTERKRIAVEEERKRVDDETRQAERFDDSKRAAFVKYLQLREEYHRVCHRIYIEKKTDGLSKLNDRARYAGADLSALVEEIGLVDPDVYDEIAMNAVRSIRDIDPKDTDGLEQWIYDDQISVMKVRDAMRTSLAIASRKPKSHNQPQLNEAPMSGTKQLPQS